MLATVLRSRAGLLRSTHASSLSVLAAQPGCLQQQRNPPRVPTHRHARQHRGLAAAATSSQKRALNPDQIQGAASAPPPPPPPSGGVRPTTGTATDPSASSSLLNSSTSNLWPIGAAVGGVAVVGGLAFYAMRRPSSEPSSSVPATTPGVAAKPATTAPAARPSPAAPAATALPETPATQTSSAPSVAATREPPQVAATGHHRVTTIQVPPKMRGGGTSATPLPVPPSIIIHPEDGHRVGVAPWNGLVPPAASTSASSATAEPLVKGLDATVTHRALAMLQPPETEVPALPLQIEARDSVVASHQSLWHSLTMAPGGALHDLESLDDVGQLRQRIIRLAAELQDRTQWEAIRLKEFLALQERTATERHQEALHQQRLELEDVLARRLRDQEHVLVQQMRQALLDKEASIQTLLNAALEGQAHEHKQALDEYKHTTTAELNAQFERQYAQELEAYKTQVTQSLQHKADALEQLSAQLQRLETALQASLTSQKGSLHAHKLSAAALALAQKLETSDPAPSELNALQAAAGTEGVVPAALATIPSAAATHGIPTLPDLQSRFDAVYRQCRQAALVPEGRPGLEGQLAGRVFATLTVPPSPDDAAPEDQPHHPEYVLARARRHVQRGELEAAVEQLERLTGQAAFTASDWVHHALHRVAVDKAVKVIKLECALVNESLLE